MWPQAGGVNCVTNAIAMTTLHRKLFHLGVFNLDLNYRVRISEKITGTSGDQNVLGKFEGKKLVCQQIPESIPAKNLLHGIGTKSSAIELKY